MKKEDTNDEYHLKEGDITRDPADIQRMIRANYKQLYIHKADKLD